MVEVVDMKNGFRIDSFEGTKSAFLLLLDKLLSPIEPQDFVEVKMTLKFKRANSKKGDDDEMV